MGITTVFILECKIDHNLGHAMRDSRHIIPVNQTFSTVEGGFGTIPLPEKDVYQRPRYEFYIYYQGSHFSGLTKFPDFSSIFFPIFTARKREGCHDEYELRVRVMS